jgi:hypothetical protein
MNIEIAAICDAATDTAGKLNMLGAFDTIFADAVPFKYQHMALALRIRFTRIEEGEHKVRINFVDDDGHSVIPPLDGKINIRFAARASSAVGNLIINLNNVEFRKEGDYSIDIAINGVQVLALPFFARIKPQNKN